MSVTLGDVSTQRVYTEVKCCLLVNLETHFLFRLYQFVSGFCISNIFIALFMTLLSTDIHITCVYICVISVSL